MLTMLFSSDYPGATAPMWQYFGASLSHSVFALCFVAFLVGRSAQIWSVPAWRATQQAIVEAGLVYLKWLGPIWLDLARALASIYCPPASKPPYSVRRSR